jgi:hypothetical protein
MTALGKVQWLTQGSGSTQTGAISITADPASLHLREHYFPAIFSQKDNRQ